MIGVLQDFFLNKTYTIANWSLILLGALSGRLFGIANELGHGPMEKRLRRLLTLDG
jgi:hypothetical protein